MKEPTKEELELLKKAQENRMKLEDEKNKAKANEALEELKKQGRIDEFKKLVDDLKINDDQAKKAEAAIILKESKDVEEAKNKINAAMLEATKLIMS